MLRGTAAARKTAARRATQIQSDNCETALPFGKLFSIVVVVTSILQLRDGPLT